MYDIFRFFVPSSRRVALSHLYSGHPPRSHDDTEPVMECCHAETGVMPIGTLSQRSKQLVHSLHAYRTIGLYTIIYDCYKEFLTDWDAGKIDNLWDAMGLEAHCQVDSVAVEDLGAPGAPAVEDSGVILHVPCLDATDAYAQALRQAIHDTYLDKVLSPEVGHYVIEQLYAKLQEVSRLSC